MIETQRNRVQRLTRAVFDYICIFRAKSGEARLGRPAINGVTNKRMAFVGHMYADLMRPARRKAAFHACRTAPEACEGAVTGKRHFSAVFGHDGHFFAIARMATDSTFDLACRWLRSAPYQGVIGALDATRFELCA